MCFFVGREFFYDAGITWIVYGFAASNVKKKKDAEC